MVSVPNSKLPGLNVVVSVTFPDPSKLTISEVTSPDKVNDLAVSKAVAVSALPVKSPVTSPVNAASVPSVPLSSTLLVLSLA